ncbi:MAG TPA: tRNA pseudouridine(38-40) synthase TruA [Planctomycetota bacterium]|nr:tRNA pseudouridine(38-40) synthase TruA [Planctomycetota bacterium]
MRNVRALISYDGSKFFGWQRQEGFLSVQECVEEALCALTGHELTVHGAGRTDSGVHALGQVAHFFVDTKITDERLRHALNFHLPPSVRIRRLETAPDDFHARFSAIGKRYMYVVATTRFRPPFAAELAHWVPQPLDIGAMREASRVLIGRHDFGAFATAGSPRKSNVRTLRSLHFIVRRERFAFVVEGDGFLYNMVRTIAGTLIEAGKHALHPSEIERILASTDRRLAGATAPPGGLYLVSVRYPVRPFRGPEAAVRDVP